jgi:hypothetical protein
MSSRSIRVFVPCMDRSMSTHRPAILGCESGNVHGNTTAVANEGVSSDHLYVQLLRHIVIAHP